MSEAPQTRRLQLANGLRVQLVADPGGQEAAALLQINVGSDDEPPAWPGLAHLLEHLLFTGSAGFSGDQRLMSWVPAQGGRLNATTRSDRTACFFAVPPPVLAAGLARLLDMLAQPTLATDAIVQEAAVIDAEYRLLQQDTATLLEVALRQQFLGADRRFHVGSQQTLGDDVAALQQALREFHQQHYHAGNMTLWLQAPLPLEVLQQLAEQAVPLLPAARPLAAQAVRRLRAGDDAALGLPGPPRLCLTFALNDWQRSDLAWLNLLNMHLRDEAPGGLMAQLRARDWVDEVQLSEPWRSRHAALFSVQFTLSRDDPAIRSGLLALFDPWLAQLAELRVTQISHSVLLSKQEFSHLSALDQLCGRAFGLAALAPPSPAGWRAGVERLRRAPRAVLWVSPSVVGQPQAHQGFYLTLARWPATPEAAADTADFTFWPQAQTRHLPPLPVAQRPLAHWLAGGEARLLLLAEPGEVAAATLQAALRPLAAQLAHQQGEWRNGRYQGQWLIQLRAAAEPLEAALVALCQRLQDLPAAACAEGQRTVQRALQQEASAIPIRRLLGALTRDLTPPDVAAGAQSVSHLCWQAALLGGDGAQQQRLAQRLSALPGRFTQRLPAPQPRPYAGLTLPRGDGDAALLLFCPLPAWTREARLMWRLLALFCQPRFFQRLRVELNLGYVVSCRFYPWGNEEGILFAVQSPHTEAEVLWQHVERFVAGLALEMSGLDEAAVEGLSQALWHSLQQQGQDPVWQVCEHGRMAEGALLSADSAAWLQRQRRADLLAWLPALQQALHDGWQGRVT